MCAVGKARLSLSLCVLAKMAVGAESSRKAGGSCKEGPQEWVRKMGNRDDKVPFVECGQILLHLVHSVVPEITDRKHVTGGIAESH